MEESIKMDHREIDSVDEILNELVQNRGRIAGFLGDEYEPSCSSMVGNLLKI